jgi:hypothetical protein
MNFKTEVQIPTLAQSISFDSKVLSIGSCFATNIGEKLAYFSFDVCTNPFGIIFNPESILKLIDRAIEERFFEPSDTFFFEGRWHCFEVHSLMSQPNQDAFLSDLNKILFDFKHRLYTSSHIILTLGTAWVYKELQSEQTVANCYKLPNKNFRKQILSVVEIEYFLRDISKKIYGVNQRVVLVWTISPVRHQKDGFIENQRSKANLLAALHVVISIENNMMQYYFPSYELLLDELRDYRFYAADMLHPTQIAIDFIWQKFQEKTIEPTCYKLLEEIDLLRKALSHTPFNEYGEAHQKFLLKTNEKLDKLKESIPGFKF